MEKQTLDATGGCPECGAPEGVECDPKCPTVESAGMGCDEARGRQLEMNDFNKFMDRILLEERRPANRSGVDSPQRLRAARYQDRPMNRTRVGQRLS